MIQEPQGTPLCKYRTVGLKKTNSKENIINQLEFFPPLNALREQTDQHEGMLSTRTTSRAWFRVALDKTFRLFRDFLLASLCLMHHICENGQTSKYCNVLIVFPLQCALLNFWLTQRIFCTPLLAKSWNQTHTWLGECLTYHHSEYLTGRCPMWKAIITSLSLGSYTNYTCKPKWGFKMFFRVILVWNIFT